MVKINLSSVRVQTFGIIQGNLHKRFGGLTQRSAGIIKIIKVSYNLFSSLSRGAIPALILQNLHKFLDAAPPQALDKTILIPPFKFCSRRESDHRPSRSRILSLIIGWPRLDRFIGRAQRAPHLPNKDVLTLDLSCPLLCYCLDFHIPRL